MPLTEEIKNKLRLAFRPHSPIEDPSAFQGRQEERERVEDAIRLPGLHTIIYGERGAGKTSLANVATASSKRIQVFCEKNSTFSSLCKNILLQLQPLSPGKFIYDAQTNTVRQDGVIFSLEKMTGNDLRSMLPTNESLCLVLDEMDRIEDEATTAAIAEFCKNLSTYQQNVTIVMVGVATTADALLRGHISNVRNLRQVSLGRMTISELNAILQHGEGVLGVNFNERVKFKILEVCDRFPYYLHLIAMNAARLALSRDSANVEFADYGGALERAASDCDEELRTTYEMAILSKQGSQIYRRVVWGLAALNDKWASKATILGAVNDIAAKENAPPVTTQAVGYALRRLTKEEDRHEIITTSKTQGFYGFSNPLMRGYVRLVRGANDKGRLDS